MAVVVGLYLLPLVHQILNAHDFLAGHIDRLDVIEEAQSPRQFAMGPRGPMWVSALYSLFVWLWPVTICLCAFRAWRERKSGRLFFWISAVCGLALLSMQFRMHYYGSFALVLPWLILGEEAAARWVKRRKLVMLLMSLAFLLMFAVPIRYSIPSIPWAGGDDNFPALRLVMLDLRKACAEDPGTVLADNDAGHIIRYYTDQHVKKLELMDHLFSISAEELPKEAPYVRYVMMRPALIKQGENGQVMYISFSQGKTDGGIVALMADLLLTPLPEVSPRYTLIRQAKARDDEKSDYVPYLRLFKLARPGEANAPRVALDTSVTDQNLSAPLGSGHNSSKTSALSYACRRSQLA
jgi:hypothetical protein